MSVDQPTTCAAEEVVPAEESTANQIDARLELDEVVKPKPTHGHCDDTDAPENPLLTRSPITTSLVANNSSSQTTEANVVGEKPMDASSGACKPKAKRSARRSLNSFVAVRIPSADIRDGLAAAQKTIIDINPRLEGALTSLDKLHITLMVLTLNDQGEIDK